MRNAFNKEVVRSITHSISRFAAIFAIVALGAGFYAGLRMCAPDMRITVDQYYDNTALMDIHLVSTLGFTDEDVEAVKQVANVSAVMPSYSADVIATIADRREAVRIHGLDLTAAAESDISSGDSALSDDENYLNRPILVEGRWPKQSGECVIDSSSVYTDAEQIGETVTITTGTSELDETFTTTEFTVVGVVDSSYYLSSSRGTTTLDDGSIDRFIYISNEDFANQDTYTDLFVTVDGAVDISTFSSDYDSLINPVIVALEAIAPERAALRAEDIKATAQSTLDEKRTEYETAKADAEAQLADGEKQLDAAAAKIAESESQLADAQNAYDAGITELASQRKDFEAQTADAQVQIDASQDDVDAQQSELDKLADALPDLKQQVTVLENTVSDLQIAYDTAVEAEAQGETVSPNSAELATLLADAQAQLTTAQQTYSAQSSTYESSVIALAEAQAQLDAKQAELDASEKAAEAEFAAAQNELDAAKETIVSGYIDLAEGRQELIDARADFKAQKASIEAKLADALAAIDDAENQIDAIETPSWYVLGRDTNMGYVSFMGDADRIEAISVVFPLIFFLVAALVALTTMTRMVEEERTLIGTYKALGYSKGRIATKYLTYAGLASIFGSIVGVIIGSQILPRVAWNAYTTMYTAPSALTPINIPAALIACLASIGITLFATLTTLWATLRENPATLMLPRAPKPGKRILLERIKPIWSRFSFLHKVTARNLFRYKKRLLMTVIGIAGCTALLLTGFGIKDSIGDILDKQYGEICSYNMTIGLDANKLSIGSENDGATDITLSDSLSELLNDSDSFSDYLIVYTESVRIENEDGYALSDGTSSEDVVVSSSSFGGITGGQSSDTSIDGYLCSPSNLPQMDEFIKLRTRIGSSPITLDDSGVVITEKAAEKLGLKVGDTIYIEHLDSTGNVTDDPAVALKVSGITEQYIAHYLYISPALYEEAFGEAPSFNEALAKAVVDDTDAQERLSQTLLGEDGVTTVQFADDITSSFDDMLNSLNSVILLLIVSAGMLAFIVLYNLTNINVTERQREIATIKVLGFYESEVNAYIYRETAALTIIGCIFGLLLGIALESFIITTVEVDVVMFGRSIHAISYVYSAALTLVFAVIVNFAMRRRLRAIDMVESLKSIE